MAVRDEEKRTGDSQTAFGGVLQQFQYSLRPAVGGMLVDFEDDMACNVMSFSAMLSVDAHL